MSEKSFSEVIYAMVELSDQYQRWRAIDYQPVVREFPIGTLLSVLSKDQRVLEIGCGVGATAIEIARAGMFVEGWDINPAAIEIARECAAKAEVDHRVRFLAQDFLVARDLPAPADAVVLIRVLTCIPETPNWVGFLDRVKRCVKPGGHLYVRDFLLSPESYSARYDRGRELGWSYGTFGSPAGREPPDFVAHHHTEEELQIIRRPYHTTKLVRELGVSMTGTAVHTFELLARKDEQNEH